jgi:hypothetical protein
MAIRYSYREIVLDRGLSLPWQREIVPESGLQASWLSI